MARICGIILFSGNSYSLDRAANNPTRCSGKLLDVEYSQDVVFDWGDLLLHLNEGRFKLIQ
jgi:hypothetical protein